MISTQLIYNAISFYRDRGYEMATVPAVVDVDISEFTKPDGRLDMMHNEQAFVGSAEQSFLQLIRNNEIDPGKYMALTPCFRDEPVSNEMTYKIFLKLELIHIGSSCCDDILDDARAFYNSEGLCLIKLTTGEGFDLVDETFGIELGSYGTRNFEKTVYAYGTGLAEPRFSYVRKRS